VLDFNHIKTNIAEQKHVIFIFIAMVEQMNSFIASK